jgi:membrane associated rhomboid family serine protease
MARLRSPTVELLAILAGVYVLQQIAAALGYGISWFALAAPAARPWTLVTSVYAHETLRHLATNAVGLALVGFPLERFTSRLRFHAFVLVTGVVAGAAQWVISGLLAQPTAVIGASGAILALYGYVLAGNPLTGGLLARLDLGRRAKVAMLAVIATLVTVLTAAPGVALIAHLTGFLLGILGGRANVL